MLWTNCLFSCVDGSIVLTLHIFVAILESLDIWQYAANFLTLKEAPEGILSMRDLSYTSAITAPHSKIYSFNNVILHSIKRC